MKKIILPFFLFLAFFTKAQNLDIGVHGGLSLYSGDLSPQPAGFSLDDLGPSGGMFLRWQISKWLALRPTLTYAYLQSDDLKNGNSNRGLNFRTNVFEFTGVLEISPVSISYYSSKTVIVPYLMVGGGFYRFNPKAEYEGQVMELQPLGTEGQGLPGYGPRYSLTDRSYPFGLGIKFVLDDQIIIAFELASRKLETDYLDDVSDTRVRYGDILDNRGPIAAQFSAPNFPPDTDPNRTYTRGGDQKDSFFTTHLSVAYRFQRRGTIYRPGKKGVICPRF